MNRQEIFDRVVAHARAQGKKSILERFPIAVLANTCAYRGVGGTKCFIGCLIDDEAYTPELESCGVLNPIVDKALRASEVTVSDQRDELFLMNLQAIHDGHGPEEWEESFARLAGAEGLTYTPPVTS